MAAFRIIRRLRDLLDFTFGTPSDGDRVTYDAATGGFVLEPSSASGAPTSADFLVGTAQAGLSAEIVVGATPGGELAGTWAAPTVDATHSGSSHASVLAAAEAYADALPTVEQLTPTAVKTSAYTAAAGDLVRCDLNAGIFTVTLPTAPADKSAIAVLVVRQNASPNTLTVAAGGSDRFYFAASGPTSVAVSTAYSVSVFQYDSATGLWLTVSDTGASAAAVTDATIATTDVTTNNASTSKHGWLKKLSNTATEYMDGTGAWSVPAGSGLGFYNRTKSGRYTGTVVFKSCVSTTMVAGTAYAMPLLLASAVTFDRIAINVVTPGAAGTLIRLGAYTDVAGYPSARIADFGTVAGDGAAFTTVIKTISQSLGPGVVWIVAVAQVNNVIVSGAGAAATSYNHPLNVSGDLDSYLAGRGASRTMSFVSGALSATWTDDNFETGIAPSVGLRAA